VEKKKESNTAAKVSKARLWLSHPRPGFGRGNGTWELLGKKGQLNIFKKKRSQERRGVSGRGKKGDGG